jgi:cyclophilin family peptidyl-prolyl cis-trans isomerase
MRDRFARFIHTAVCLGALAAASLAGGASCEAAPPRASQSGQKSTGKAVVREPAPENAKGALREASEATAEPPAPADPAADARRKKRPLISKPATDEVAAIKAEGKKVAVVETARGKIRFDLFVVDAPLTVANFVKLARAGFYDGLTFHRVVKEPKPFVFQGGDPLGNGMGNPGYTIEGEFSQVRQHLEGTVAMARARDPNSAGCQFYICLAAAPELDGQYAVFGQVIEGMGVVQAIAQGDVMTRVTIESAEEP